MTGTTVFATGFSLWRFQWRWGVDQGPCVVKRTDDVCARGFSHVGSGMLHGNSPDSYQCCDQSPEVRAACMSNTMA
jgi:hypothetical protein